MSIPLSGASAAYPPFALGIANEFWSKEHTALFVPVGHGHIIVHHAVEDDVYWVLDKLGETRCEGLLATALTVASMINQ